MSEDRYHGFGDIVQGTAGIFGNDTPGLASNAHQAFHQVHVEAMPQGVATRSQCQSCPRGQVIMIHWAEMLSIFYNVRPDVGLQQIAHMLPQYKPSNWALDPKYGWVPVERCACGDNAQPAISYQEVAQLVERGRKSGWIIPQSEERLRQHLQAVQAQLAQAGMTG